MTTPRFKVLKKGGWYCGDSHLCDLPAASEFEPRALIQCMDCCQLWALKKSALGRHYWLGIRKSLRNAEWLVTWRKYDGLPARRWHFWLRRKV